MCVKVHICKIYFILFYIFFLLRVSFIYINFNLLFMIIKNSVKKLDKLIVVGEVELKAKGWSSRQ